MIWTKCTKKVISLQLTQLDLEFIPDFAQEKLLQKCMCSLSQYQVTYRFVCSSFPIRLENCFDNSVKWQMSFSSFLAYRILHWQTREYATAAQLANRLPVLATATMLQFGRRLYAASEINHMLSSLLRSPRAARRRRQCAARRREAEFVRVRGWLYYTFSRHQIIFSRIE